MLNLWGSRSQLRKVDCIVVLGARVQSDGRLGHSLQGRMDQAVSLCKAGWSPHLLTTGGHGDSGSVESLAARAEAVRQGLAVDQVAVEEMSHTTWENLYFARDVMHAQGWRTCLIVTDPYHMPRSLAMAHELGLDAYAAPCAQPRLGRLLFYSSRELLAIMKYAFHRTARS